VKTAVGLVLLCLTACWLAVAAVFHLRVEESLFDSWLLFLSGLLTISAFGQGWKQSVVARTAAAAGKAGAP
jgi:uncharacterized membrane protein